MLTISVDDNKCLKDGLCEKICPMGLIQCSDSEPFVRAIPDFHHWCIGCGHCLAICPSGALSHSRIASEKCRSMNADQIIEPEKFELFLQNRRSIRRFKSKVPDRALLQKMISMTSYAPSGHNQQPVRWKVYDDHTQILHMAGLVVDWMKHVMGETSGLPQAVLFSQVVKAWENDTDVILHHAPCLVVAHTGIMTGTEPIDTIAAMSYLELISITMGLGCCWAGLFLMAIKAWKPLSSYLDLPAGHRVHGAMMVGYPKYKFQRAPTRNLPDIKWASSDSLLKDA